jgi:hypothetical protein
VQISLLYVDGCPHLTVADRRLREALQLVGLGDQDVERVLVSTDEQAQVARFRGSPTILIDGDDPFGTDRVGGFGLTCRVYATPDGPAGSPTVADLVAALTARA